MDRQLTGRGPAQQAAVLHRNDEQRVVRKPAEAGRLAGNGQHLLLPTPRVYGEDGVAIEVGDPPAPVVPPRPFEEGAALKQQPQWPAAHSVSFAAEREASV